VLAAGYCITHAWLSSRLPGFRILGFKIQVARCA
jgi:hypothetical protein